MSIKTRLGHCGECKWFRPLPNRDSYWNDGECKNPIHVGKNRTTPYRVYSRAACCYDAEDPDTQMTIEEVMNGN